MKNLLFAVTLLLTGPFMYSQEQEQPDLPEAAYELYPALDNMYGFAVGTYDDKILILGGQIQTDVPELYKQDFPNLEVILIDLRKKRTSAFSSEALRGILGEQMGASGLAYYQEEILYVLGGYGYSDTHKRFITFPYLTAIDLKETINELLEGKNPEGNLFQVRDENLAIFNSTMDFNGDEYFLLDGKYAYKVNPFEENAEFFEETREGEIRTFRIDGEREALQVNDFHVWYDADDFRAFYGPMIPPKVEGKLKSINQYNGEQ